MRVAILPAAGKGERMIRRSARGTFPKQLLPLASGQRVIDYALSAAVLADCWPHIIVPRGDEEIARYVKRGSFSYAVDDGNKPLADIAALRPVYEGAEILYVMPDTVFKPVDVGETLFELFYSHKIALACFHTNETHRFGMCFQGSDGIYSVTDKPPEWDTHGRGSLAWGLIAWHGSLMWDAIGNCLRDDTSLSWALRGALCFAASLPYAVLDDYRDIGTSEDYERALEEGW